MRKNSIFYLSLLSLAIFPGYSQNNSPKNLSAFSDYRNYFFAFDDGATRQLEYQPVKTYKTGGNCIAYIDNQDNFKAYYNGIAYNLADITPKEYFVTDDIVVFMRNNILSVFDDGETKILSTATSNYDTGDSIVGFFNEVEGIFKVYYGGNTRNLEGVLVDNVLSIDNAKAGDNILAYINHNGYLKVFYHDQVFELETVQPQSYEAAASIVAYVDSYTQSFKVFFDGTVSTLESIPPQSYKMADNMVAYVDNTGHFKIFYRGETLEISTFEPQFYEVEDNIVAYYDNINFKVFYKGKIFSLEKYVPSDYKKDFSTLAYIDRSGYLKVFYDGQLQQVSQDKINNFELSENTVLYRTGGNNVNFFSKGKGF